MFYPVLADDFLFLRFRAVSPTVARPEVARHRQFLPGSAGNEWGVYQRLTGKAKGWAAYRPMVRADSACGSDRRTSTAIPHSSTGN